MITMKRLFIWLLAATLLSSCAGTTPAVNPRSMTFPPLQFEIPKSERAVLPNGMVLYMLQDHELPLVNITAYINTGSIYEPEEKTGLASLTGAVMRSGGAGRLTPEQLDAELEFMASRIEAGIGPDSGTVSAASLTKNLDRTLKLFGEVLMRPGFREDRVKLAVARSLEGIRRQNDDPKAIADRELNRALYAGHPLGRVPTMASVGKITRDDLVDFHRRYFHPNNIILAVSGDFDREQMISRLNELFSGWPKAEVRLPLVPEPKPAAPPEILFARKDVSQSVIRMGEMGIEKNNPDLYSLRVMDYILGGGFTSRLVQEIRSNQGLAYSVDSDLDVGRRFIGTIGVDTETKSGSTVHTISLIREIVASMTKAPVSDQELALAKDSIVNSFIFGFTKPDVVVNQQARLEFYGYPQDYLEKYRENIRKVTKDDVLRVSRQYLHPMQMVLMVVGNEKDFDKPLNSLGPVREIKLEIK